MSTFEIFDGAVLPPIQRGKHGHAVGMVDDNVVSRVAALRAHNSRMSIRTAVKQVIGVDDVYFDAKYQTIVRALRTA